MMILILMVKKILRLNMEMKVVMAARLTKFIYLQTIVLNIMMRFQI